MWGTMIGRPALVHELERATAFALVVAGPGFGKSTLLAEWESHDARPFVHVRAGVAPVGRAIEQPARPFVLVVDALEALTTDDVAVLSGLAERDAALGTVVALCGRAVDRGLLSRLRLRGDVVEIGAAELAFDVPEAAQVIGGGVDEAEIAALVRRTLGWPAAIRLAAVARRQGLPSLDRFTGADRLVADYLHTRVFPELGPDRVDFLRRCSVLNLLSGSLCDAVLDRTDSGDLLDELAWGHLFVDGVDREGERFRLHPIVRDALAAELERAEPGTPSALRAAAAQWLAAHGRGREEIALRLQNGERATALNLLADVVLPMFSSGDMPALIEFIHEIGADVAVDSGYLATMFAYAGLMTGDLVCAQRWGRSAQLHYATHRFGTTDEEVVYFTFRGHLAPDGVAVMREDAQRACDVVRESSDWRVPAVMLAGIAAALCGDVREAAVQLEAAVHLSAERAIRPALVLALAEQALLAERAGLRARARDLIDRSAAAARDGLAGYPHAALPFALQAVAAAREGDPARARESFAAANALRPVAGAALPWLGVQVRLALGRAAVILGELGVARTVVGEAEELIALLPDARGLHDELDEVVRSVAELPDGARASGASLLTTAELRLLPLLSSHLSFEEIGQRFHLSRNTVKTQAISIYRKLGASSRSDAVARASAVGLLPV